MMVLFQSKKLAVHWWKEADWDFYKGKRWMTFNLGRLQLIFINNKY